MAKAKTRIERDSMGEMTVPSDALYGATTQRAVLNFPIANRPVPMEVVYAFAMLKQACAETNNSLGKLDARRKNLIVRACNQIVADGEEMQPHFLIDIFRISDPSESRGNSITAREVLDRQLQQA